MKKYFFILIASSLFFSCSNDKISEEANDQKIAAQTIGVQNIDGTLHFTSSEDCLATIQRLSEDQCLVKDFEKEYGFKSLSSYVDEAIDVISRNPNRRCVFIRT